MEIAKSQIGVGLVGFLVLVNICAIYRVGSQLYNYGEFNLFNFIVSLFQLAGLGIYGLLISKPCTDLKQRKAFAGYCGLSGLISLTGFIFAFSSLETYEYCMIIIPLVNFAVAAGLAKPANDPMAVTVPFIVIGEVDTEEEVDGGDEEQAATASEDEEVPV